MKKEGAEDSKYELPGEPQVTPFTPPSESFDSLPYNDAKVLDIVERILDPKGIQRLQFTEIEVTWVRPLIRTDVTEYMLTVAQHAGDNNFDWLSYNTSKGYRETSEILLPSEVVQYSLAKWQRGKNRKLIRDAHELAVSAGAETEEAKMMRTAFKG